MAKKTPLSLSCCLCALYIGFLAGPAMAKNKADIVDIAVTMQRKNLEVSFKIENCFTPKMEEAIGNGVPTTFRIRLILEKPGIPFLRSQYLNIVLERTIKYDRLENEYRVELQEHPDRLRTTRDLEEAKEWMSSVEDLPLIPLWRLQEGQTYQLRMKAELSKVHLPLFFRYIFFFVSLWDFETDWQKITFSP
jgi:hypothetical protein